VRDAVNWINQASERSPLERAGYALWRFNWVHPFRGGNGRTSRAVAYLIVCMAEQMMLPGKRAIQTSSTIDATNTSPRSAKWTRLLALTKNRQIFGRWFYSLEAF
jgi:Fic family protein